MIFKPSGPGSVSLILRECSLFFRWYKEVGTWVGVDALDPSFSSIIGTETPPEGLEWGL